MEDFLFDRWLVQMQTEVQPEVQPEARRYLLICRNCLNGPRPKSIWPSNSRAAFLVRAGRDCLKAAVLRHDGTFLDR